MENIKTTRVYDDNRIKDITDSLVAIKKSKDNNIPDKLLSLLRLDEESQLKRTINSELGRLHSCEITGGDLSNTVRPQIGCSSLNNALLGLDEDLNPIYLNGLNKHLMITGGSGSGKSTFILNLLRQVFGNNGGATVIDGKGYDTDLEEFMSLAKQYNRLDDVFVLDFSERNSGLVKTPITSTFNIFKEMGVRSAMGVLKQVITGDSKPAGSGNDFFNAQQIHYLDNCSLILEYLDQNGKDINLAIFNEITDLKAHIIQAIPASNPEAPEDQQVPDEKLVSLNMLNGFEKYWIPKTYGTTQGAPYVEKILYTLSEYGFYVETNPDAEYDPLGDNPQISEQLQKQIANYAMNGFSKLKTLSDKYDYIFNKSESGVSFRYEISQGKIIYIKIGKLNKKQNASNLGSFLINSLADAVFNPLGKNLENERDLVKKFPGHLLVLDEIGPFINDSIEPLDIMLTQARSVNCSIILSSQNNAGITAENKEEFKQKVNSNTHTKINFPKIK